MKWGQFRHLLVPPFVFISLPKAPPYFAFEAAFYLHQSLNLGRSDDTSWVSMFVNYEFRFHRATTRADSRQAEARENERDFSSRAKLHALVSFVGLNQRASELGLVCLRNSRAHLSCAHLSCALMRASGRPAHSDRAPKIKRNERTLESWPTRTRTTFRFSPGRLECQSKACMSQIRLHVSFVCDCDGRQPEKSAKKQSDSMVAPVLEWNPFQIALSDR